VDFLTYWDKKYSKGSGGWMADAQRGRSTTHVSAIRSAREGTHHLITRQRHARVATPADENIWCRCIDVSMRMIPDDTVIIASNVTVCRVPVDLYVIAPRCQAPRQEHHCLLGPAHALGAIPSSGSRKSYRVEGGNCPGHGFPTSRGE
jgi:hypothetical protein